MLINELIVHKEQHDLYLLLLLTMIDNLDMYEHLDLQI